jgi:hypothetical protein
MIFDGGVEILLLVLLLLLEIAFPSILLESLIIGSRLTTSSFCLTGTKNANTVPRLIPIFLRRS